MDTGYILVLFHDLSFAHYSLNSGGLWPEIHWKLKYGKKTLSAQTVSSVPFLVSSENFSATFRHIYCIVTCVYHSLISNNYSLEYSLVYLVGECEAR